MKTLLIFAVVVVAFLADKHVSALGVQDFRDLEIFPVAVNTYKDRVIFYLDSDCDPSACLLSCSALHFGRGVCSANPRSCICTSTGQVHLSTSNLTIGSSVNRVYQFGNDWTIFPETKCLSNVACERSCQQQKFREGTCLKFNTQHSECACRRPTEALRKDATIPAPFPVHFNHTRVTVYNNSVYLTTDLCRQKNCEKYCEKFNLANGVCHYYRGSSCKCDTGMNETRVVSDLQIKSYAGGIYTLNGWHLFEHDSSVECTDKLCAPVCQSWGFESEVACFPGNGITNSCGCQEYKSDVPSAEELAKAREDAKASAVRITTILPQFAILLFALCFAGHI